MTTLNRDEERMRRREARTGQLESKKAEAKKAAAAERRSRPAPTTLRPAATGFDFLSGDYQRAQNSRLVAIGLAGLLTLAVLAMAGWGFLTSSQAAAQATQLSAARAAAQSAQQRYAVATQVNGVNLDTIQADMHARLGGLKAATSSEVNVGKFLTDLNAAIPANISLNEIAIAPAATTAPAPAAPSTGATLPTTSSDKPVSYQVTITAHAPSFDYVDQWKAALASMKYLRIDGDPLFSAVQQDAGTGSTYVTITSTGTISTADLPSHHVSQITQLPGGQK